MLATQRADSYFGLKEKEW